MSPEPMPVDRTRLSGVSPETVPDAGAAVGNELNPESIGRWADLSEARMHVVSGKGGTGKTTVAAALALALAAHGRRTLLIEVEGRQGASPGCSTYRHCPTRSAKVAIAPAAATCSRWRSTPRPRCWSTWTCSQHAPGRQRPAQAGAIDFATTIAPGVRDVLLTGKAMEAVKRKDGGRFVYDAVVMDARRPAASCASSTSTARSRAWPRSAPSAIRPTR